MDEDSNFDIFYFSTFKDYIHKMIEFLYIHKSIF